MVSLARSVAFVLRITAMSWVPLQKLKPAFGARFIRSLPEHRADEEDRTALIEAESSETQSERHPKTQQSSDANVPSQEHVPACSICLDDFKDGDIIKSLPSCNHQFHAECVKNWLATQASCPMCRQRVEPCHQQEREDLTCVSGLRRVARSIWTAVREASTIYADFYTLEMLTD